MAGEARKRLEEAAQAIGQQGRPAIHLTLDTLTPEPATREQIERWLLETPAAIGMTAISPPIVHEIEGRIGAFRIIAESHLAAHVDGPVLSLDVFSCKEFPYSWVIQDAQRRFGFKVYRYNLDLERLNLETI